MSDFDVCWMNALELVNAFTRKKLSPVEALNAVLSRVEEVNPRINAIVTLTAEAALECAKRAEAAYMRGEARELEGVPLTVKDLIPVKDVRCTFGSRFFEDFVPEMDAVVVERMKRAGAVIIGKTNTPEFGLVAVTDNSVFGPARNPWDTAKTPGGSSGGAAAALAAGLGPIALGNDGGGSIRIPSGLCGTFGLKPQYGRVPSWPHIMLNYMTLNCEGPMTRSVADAALMMDVLAGPDERDRTSLPDRGGSYLSSIGSSMKGLRIAYTDLISPVVETEVASVAAAAAKVFIDMGCDVSDDAPDMPDLSEDLTKLVILETAAANEDRMDQKEKLFPPYQPFMDLPQFLSPLDTVKVYFHREELWDKLWPFFERYDLLLTPTTTCAAFDIKENQLGPEEVNGTPVTPASWVSYTFPFNFTGQPAASVPCGFTEAGLPVGLQIVGGRYREDLVLKAAAAFEEARPWAQSHPSI